MNSALTYFPDSWSTSSWMVRTQKPWPQSLISSVTRTESSPMIWIKQSLVCETCSNVSSQDTKTSCVLSTLIEHRIIRSCCRRWVIPAKEVWNFLLGVGFMWKGRTWLLFKSGKATCHHTSQLYYNWSVVIQHIYLKLPGQPLNLEKLLVVSLLQLTGTYITI